MKKKKTAALPKHSKQQKDCAGVPRARDIWGVAFERRYEFRSFLCPGDEALAAGAEEEEDKEAGAPARSAADPGGAEAEARE